MKKMPGGRARRPGEQIQRDFPERERTWELPKEYDPKSLIEEAERWREIARSRTKGEDALAIEIARLRDNMEPMRLRILQLEEELAILRSK